MKKRAIIFFKNPTLILPFFLASMIASGLALFIVDESYLDASLMGMRITVGITLFLGMLSVYILSANREQKVVYIKKEVQKEDEINQVSLSELSQLHLDEINKVMADTNGSLQEALNEVCNQLQAGQGAIYVAKENVLKLQFGYALSVNKNETTTYDFGEGLIGRVAAERKSLYIDKLPKDYMTIFSGLGSASPSYLAIVPIANEKEVNGVLEISTFHPMNNVTLGQLQEVATVLTDSVQRIIE